MNDEFNDKENQMTGKDAAAHFNCPVPVEKTLPDFKMMTKEEVEKWEKDEMESSDIYRISARVKNLARDGGGSLTPVGESMCNLYVHVIKSFYDFADTLETTKREEFRALIRSHEGMPGKLISLTRKK